MRIGRFVLFGAILAVALAVPLGINPDLFATNCNTQPFSILCDLAQTHCSDCTTTCLTTCQETQAQNGFFTTTYTMMNVQTVQDTTSIICNKVFGCRIYPATGGCILDPNDPLPPQYKFPYKAAPC